nr:MAG TPA_asm: hypothetical protein [Caudoviricetes sp.]
MDRSPGPSLNCHQMTIMYSALPQPMWNQRVFADLTRS